MKFHLIILKRADGSFAHATHGQDEADTRSLFELMKFSRCAKAIPIMELYEIELGEPLEVNIKEPK